MAIQWNTATYELKVRLVYLLRLWKALLATFTAASTAPFRCGEEGCTLQSVPFLAAYSSRLDLLKSSRWTSWLPGLSRGPGKPCNKRRPPQTFIDTRPRQGRVQIGQMTGTGTVLAFWISLLPCMTLALCLILSRLPAILSCTFWWLWCASKVPSQVWKEEEEQTSHFPWSAVFGLHKKVARLLWPYTQPAKSPSLNVCHACSWGCSRRPVHVGKAWHWFSSGMCISSSSSHGSNKCLLLDAHNLFPGFASNVFGNCHSVLSPSSLGLAPVEITSAM